MNPENNKATVSKNVKSQPAISTPKRIDAPIPEISELPNGVSIYFHNCSEQEAIRVSFVFRAGTSLQKIPFSASATANLLSEGSNLHSAHEIAEQLDFYGSYYDVALDRDYAVITFVSISKYFEKTLDIAREILLMPAFEEHEIETYCVKRKNRLKLERSKVSQKVRELFSKSLYGENHPYGAAYPESFYDNITREDIWNFYKARYTTSNCFVVCSGKVDENSKELITALSAEIPRGGDDSLPVLPDPECVKISFAPQKNAVQSAIRIGRVLFPRNHSDYIPMQMVTTILGGYFGSRLVTNLREKHGYTYGVFAGMVNMELSGYMAISTEVSKESTLDALAQIYHEMERMCTEPVSFSELEMVRNIMTGEVMRVLDGPFGIADVTIENIQNGTDNYYLERFLSEICSITPEHIMKTAQKYLSKDDFTTTVVGDRSLEKYLQ